MTLTQSQTYTPARSVLGAVSSLTRSWFPTRTKLRSVVLWTLEKVKQLLHVRRRCLVGSLKHGCYLAIGIHPLGH